MFTLLLCWKSNTIAQNSITQDIEPSRFNKELLINIEGDTIAGYALIADGDLKKQTAIIIKGYPGNDSNFDLAQELRNNGFNVILFDHRGAWGSQGIYLYSNCLKDIEIIINYLKEPHVSEQLRIDKNRFILIGRSLGGGIALISGSQIDNVKKIIGISNVNYGELMQKHNNISELKSYAKYMKKQIMINHDINEFLEELIANKKAFNIANYSKELSRKEVLLIEDSHKNMKWTNELKESEIRYLISDHNFSTQRNQMINEIINWLK